MRNFKRAALSLALFCAILIGFTALFTGKYLKGDAYYYQDAAVRRGLEGSVETVYIGSSFCLRAFVPELIELDGTGYNLAGALMSMRGRYLMLKKELERNPVKTVVMELGVTALSRERAEEGPEGDLYVLGRLDGFWERVKWAYSAFTVNEHMRLWYDSLNRGLYTLRHPDVHAGSATGKRLGFAPVGARDVTLAPGELERVKDTEKWDARFEPENKKYFEKIMELLKERNVRLIFVTTPSASRAIWAIDGLDEMLSSYRELAEKYGAEYYNMDLLRDRDVLFPDDAAFFDRLHLSAEGAETMSRAFSNIMKAVSRGESADGFFFQSYAEVRSFLSGEIR